MKSIRVEFRHTAETMHPMHEFVCESPAVDREVLLEGRSEDGTETIVSYVEGDREAYEAALASTPRIEEYDVTPEGEDAFYLYARAELGEQGQLLERALSRETLVVVPPIEFLPDRTMRATLIGHPDDLRAALDALPDGIGVEVLEVGEYARGGERTLSDRQREAVAAAWAVGYYDVPRESGVEAVADELDCAASTASELLRRAEAGLVADALGEPR